MAIYRSTGIGSQRYGWDDTQSSVQIVPSGATAPSLLAIRGGNVFLNQYDGNDVFYSTIQLPHMLLPDPVLNFHVHFMFPMSTAASNTAGFRMDYTWANVNGTFGAEANTGTITHTCAGQEQYIHQVKALASLTLTGALASAIVAFRIIKLDGTAGIDPAILAVDAHYQKGDFGTAGEFS
jgi:hypothetical protein